MLRKGEIGLLHVYVVLKIDSGEEKQRQMTNKEVIGRNPGNRRWWQRAEKEQSKVEWSGECRDRCYVQTTEQVDVGGSDVGQKKKQSRKTSRAAGRKALLFVGTEKTGAKTSSRDVEQGTSGVPFGAC